MPLIMRLNNNRNPELIALIIIVIIIAIVVIFTPSCMVNRKGELTEKGKNFIAEHCKGRDSVNVSDHTEISFDTIKIPFPVKGETIYLKNPCDSLGRLKDVNLSTKKNGIITSVKSVGNVLIEDCDTDSLMEIIQKQKRTISEFKDEKTVIEKPCDKEHVTSWDYFWIKVGIISLGFLVLQILIRIASLYPILSWLRIFYLFKF